VSLIINCLKNNTSCYLKIVRESIEFKGRPLMNQVFECQIYWKISNILHIFRYLCYVCYLEFFSDFVTVLSLKSCKLDYLQYTSPYLKDRNVKVSKM